MLDFSAWLDLPLIWGVLIATAVFLYAVLDGFDLGCGILFPFAPTDNCRSRMMNSIAPFWDGNETWLVLGGGGLFVAFPAAYSIILPALYIPITFMLLGLVFRGIAFEFRFKASEEYRGMWDVAFHAGSLLATFMQGMILGNFVQGLDVDGRAFSGGSLDFANGFAIMTGIALIFGYALLGATWLIMKTEGETQQWARRVARYVMVFVALAMIFVSVRMALIDDRVYQLWFSSPNIFFLLPVPVITAYLFVKLWQDITAAQREYRPFIFTLLLFLLGYIGFGISLYPWIVPYHFTLWDAAAVAASQSFVLIGALIFLPIILCYTAYCYYVFRGKSSHEHLY